MSTLASLAPLLPFVVYLAGAAAMARLIFGATDGGRALVEAGGATLGACLLWVIAWPVFAVLLVGVVVVRWAQR